MSGRGRDEGTAAGPEQAVRERGLGRGPCETG